MLGPSLFNAHRAANISLPVGQIFNLIYAGDFFHELKGVMTRSPLQVSRFLAGLQED